MSNREDVFAKLREQESCEHKWLPREHVQTSHGKVWRTECASCGRYVSRGDHGDLSAVLAEMEHEHQGSWILRLECCGRATGFQVCKSWEAANEFRRDYCNDSLGHVRSAIVSKLDRPARLGYCDEPPITPMPSEES